MKPEVGDVVRLGSNLTDWWDTCLLEVEEVRSWGLIGVVRGPDKADYPLRVAFDTIVAVYRKIEEPKETNDG